MGGTGLLRHFGVKQRKMEVLSSIEKWVHCLLLQLQGSDFSEVHPLHLLLSEGIRNAISTALRFIHYVSIEVHRHGWATPVPTNYAS